MANHILGALALPAGLVWTDEFSWRPVEQSQEYGVTGALVVDVAERLAGRPITLEATDDHGWISRATLQTLYGLAGAPDATYTFQHADARSFTVMIESVEARAVSRPELPPASWPYVVKLKLIEV